MFDLNLTKLDQYSFSMKYVAMTNLLAAWYMLSCLELRAPHIDATLARIYFTEYGVNLDGLTDDDIIEMAKEYEEPIKNFFIKCQIQRCENIIDRFGKVCCDNRLDHAISLPPQCKNFFLEILELASNRNTYNITTKETQCLDSLRDSMIINNTETVTHNHNGRITASLDKEYFITPVQFATYADIIHSAVIDLYRPSSGFDETHEDWGTKFRRIVDYIKTLAFLATRDVACKNIGYWFEDNNQDFCDPQVMFRAPFLDFGMKDELFKGACLSFKRAYFDRNSLEGIQATVAPYSSLAMEHAICLFHNTNAVLDVSKLPQNWNSDTFKFLCSQEMIYYLDMKMKTELVSRGTPTQSVG